MSEEKKSSDDIFRIDKDTFAGRGGMDQFHEEMQRQLKESVRKEAERRMMFGDVQVAYVPHPLWDETGTSKPPTFKLVFPFGRRNTYAETSFGYIRLL